MREPPEHPMENRSKRLWPCPRCWNPVHRLRWHHPSVRLLCFRCRFRMWLNQMLGVY